MCSEHNAHGESPELQGWEKNFFEEKWVKLFLENILCEHHKDNFLMNLVIHMCLVISFKGEETASKSKFLQGVQEACQQKRCWKENSWNSLVHERIKHLHPHLWWNKYPHLYPHYTQRGCGRYILYIAD